MKKTSFSLLTVVLGVLLLAAGIYLVITQSDSKGVMAALPFVMVGIGSGLFGQGIGVWLQRRKLAHSTTMAQLQANERNDERNIAIANRAKAKAFDIMVYVLAALMLSFTLFGVAPVATLSLVGVYLFLIGCHLYYTTKYSKEM